MSNAWKAAEKGIAPYLDGVRNFNSGGVGCDVNSPWCFPDVKRRQSNSPMLERIMRVDDAVCKVWSDIVLVYVEHLQRLAHGEIGLSYTCVTQGDLAGLRSNPPHSIRSQILHMAKQATADKLPCAIYAYPNKPYARAIVAANLDQFEHWAHERIRRGDVLRFHNVVNGTVLVEYNDKQAFTLSTESGRGVCGIFDDNGTRYYVRDCFPVIKTWELIDYKRLAESALDYGIKNTAALVHTLRAWCHSAGMDTPQDYKLSAMIIKAVNDDV